jgi:hypothetical protein
VSEVGGEEGQCERRKRRQSVMVGLGRGGVGPHGLREKEGGMVMLGWLEL